MHISCCCCCCSFCCNQFWFDLMRIVKTQETSRMVSGVRHLPEVKNCEPESSSSAELGRQNHPGSLPPPSTHVVVKVQKAAISIDQIVLPHCEVERRPRCCPAHCLCSFAAGTRSRNQNHFQSVQFLKKRKNISKSG